VKGDEVAISVYAGRERGLPMFTSVWATPLELIRSQVLYPIELRAHDDDEANNCAN